MRASELMADVLPTCLPDPPRYKKSHNHRLYSDGCLDKTAGMDVSVSFQILSSRIRQ